MAGKKKETEYQSKAITTSIEFTSRASVKVGESFYTVECCETRSLPPDADVEKERAILWDIVNGECDAQIQDILKTFKK